jgi:hypothetical protein
MTAPVRIGIIDGGVSADQQACLARARDFTDGGSETDLPDRFRHGVRITAEIRGTAPDAVLVHARAFSDKGVSSPRRIAEALDWLSDESVDLVNMSFGLAADRAPLRDSCARALAAGLVLIAAAPAQGGPCFPAAYEGVIAVTGDARCGRDQVSHLAAGPAWAGSGAVFGTWCASPERLPDAQVSGASLACAHFTGLAARWWATAPRPCAAELVAQFISHADFVGPERRSGPARAGAARD